MDGLTKFRHASIVIVVRTILLFIITCALVPFAYGADYTADFRSTGPLDALEAGQDFGPWHVTVIRGDGAPDDLVLSDGVLGVTRSTGGDYLASLALPDLSNAATRTVSITLRSWGEEGRGRIAFGFLASQSPAPVISDEAYATVIQKTGGETKVFNGPGFGSEINDWSLFTRENATVTYTLRADLKAGKWELEVSGPDQGEMAVEDAPFLLPHSGAPCFFLFLSDQVEVTGPEGLSKVSALEIKVE